MTNERVKALEAEVERLTGSLEIALSHLTERGHPEDVARYARLHIEAALAGRSRPLILAERRAEAAEAKVARLRETIRTLRSFHGNSIDPNECMECEGGHFPCRSAEVADAALADAPAEQ
jgi:hypothetical protein